MIIAAIAIGVAVRVIFWVWRQRRPRKDFNDPNGLLAWGRGDT